MQEEIKSEASKRWSFNPLFEKYSLEDAVSKACAMEVERANLTHLPLVQDIYQPGWKEWQNMPGAQVIQDLIEEDTQFNREHKGDPWFPKIGSNSYIWKGELTDEQLRTVEFHQFGINDNGGATTYFSLTKAWLDGKRDLRELGTWWQFDEDTHKQMRLYQYTNFLGFKTEDLYAAGDRQLKLLKEEEKMEIDKDSISSATRFQAFRDGPAIVCGANMLLERENVWTSRNNYHAYRNHYKWTNDALLYVNVHTYIDLFHVRLGEYVIGKYCDTKEKQELVKAAYKSQRRRQLARSKIFYEKFFKGEIDTIGLDDVDGNMA